MSTKNREWRSRTLIMPGSKSLLRKLLNVYMDIFNRSSASTTLPIYYVISFKIQILKNVILTYKNLIFVETKMLYESRELYVYLKIIGIRSFFLNVCSTMQLYLYRAINIYVGESVYVKTTFEHKYKRNTTVKLDLY